MKMPFGEHKGTPIDELPRDYIRWLQTMGWVRGQLKRVVEEVARGIDIERHAEVLSQTGPPPFEPTHHKDKPVDE